MIDTDYSPSRLVFTRVGVVRAHTKKTGIVSGVKLDGIGIGRIRTVSISSDYVYDSEN